MSDGFGNPGKNFMLRAFVSIGIAVLGSTFLVFGFQDGLTSFAGGALLATPVVILMGAMTWYNFNYTGYFKRYASIAAIIADVLAAILIAVMLAHIQVPAAH